MSSGCGAIQKIIIIKMKLQTINLRYNGSMKIIELQLHFLQT